MFHLTDSIHCIEGLKLGRVYLIQSADGLSMIDASMPGMEDRIERDMQANGMHLQDVKRILLTHAHWDHYGSLAALKERSGAEVYVAAHYDASVVRGQQNIIYTNPEEMGLFDRAFASVWLPQMKRFQISVPVEHELKEGDVLDHVLPGLQVVALPGHTQGQIGFWLEDERLLIGGDVMMNLGNKLALPLRSATPDMQTARQSIGKVRELHVETLLLGHGPARQGGAWRAVNEFAAKLRI